MMIEVMMVIRLMMMCCFTVYSEGRRPARSLSLRDSARNNTAVTTTSSSSSASSTLTRHHDNNNYDIHDTLAAMNDSALYCHVSAQSPLTPTPTPTPAATHVRNGSGDYQAHQTELKYISSEDSGLVSGSYLFLGRNKEGLMFFLEIGGCGFLWTLMLIITYCLGICF